MKSQEIRKTFLDFFNSKGHQIVNSAPMLIKDDPSLMFTNAGMNQFKDIFLGNSQIKYKRVSDSQKCLRVSGKHNDLEEVGHDTYHHTMFEMLGNWSFGDYFKEDAINFAWELLVNIFKIDKDKLYVTIFEGNKKDGLEQDKEALKFWKKHLPENRILNGSKKDNFWEMGETGPCGACSEIHIDIRDKADREKIDGKDLVNKDHPQVIEIWNLVFIEFNRKVNGNLEKLDKQHVDTGMGFERLCMIIQGKKSNYDTDVFQPILKKIGEIANVEYGKNEKIDIAMRVISDHLRTLAFSITDGQLPSNNKAGYVIRRILRRAVRYAYTFLNINESFMAQLVPSLIDTMGKAYPELKAQQNIIEKVITEEENSFLRTLEIGIKLLENIIDKTKKANEKIISGVVAFDLYDTYGFPLDLTNLMLKEVGLEVDEESFAIEMQKQKKRSKKAGSIKTSDWIVLKNHEQVHFVGYEKLECETKIIKYRKIVKQEKNLYQVVLTDTPFYAESGGQVGDKGVLISNKNVIKVIDTQRENNLIIHYLEKMPHDISSVCIAKVHDKERQKTENNHTATHLLHTALREVLGTHIEQKGSFVNEDYLRFDFSHFQKLSEEEIEEVEKIVNSKIRKNISLKIFENITMKEAQKMGAIALFGEKYGEFVRAVIIEKGFSTELCGGTHVKSTGEIGLFKITTETAIASGIRRIEAITAKKAEDFMNEQFNTLKSIQNLFKNPTQIVRTVENLINENNQLKKQIQSFEKSKAKDLKKDLINNAEIINDIRFIGKKVIIDNANALRDLAFQLKQEKENIFAILGAEIQGKANLTLIISENLVKENNWNAGKMIREIAKEIKGGGGGQAFFATAGGKNPQGIEKAINKAKDILTK